MAILTRTLLALGVSVIFVSCLRLISLIYPPEKFSTFSGITVTIGTLGAISAGLPLYALLHDFSWQSIHIGIGIIGILLTIGIYISFFHVQKNHPQLFESISTYAITKDRSLLKSVIMNQQSWYAMGINFFVGATVFGFSGLWGVRYLTSVVGASSLQGTLALSCFFAGFGSGSFLLGSLSSLLGRRKPPMILGSMASLGLVGFLVIAPVYSIEIYYVIYALVGFFGSAFTVAWASAKENNSPDAAGMATSTANIGAFIGTALMQPTMGWMLDHSQKIAQLPLFSGTLSSFHPFKPIFALMWVFHLFSLMCILAIRETYCKNQQVTTS
jgi:MFS family permease